MSDVVFTNIETICSCTTQNVLNVPGVTEKHKTKHYILLQEWISFQGEADLRIKWNISMYWIICGVEKQVIQFVTDRTKDNRMTEVWRQVNEGIFTDTRIVRTSTQPSFNKFQRPFYPSTLKKKTANNQGVSRHPRKEACHKIIRICCYARTCL